MNDHCNHLNKAEQFYLDYIQEYPDAKLPYMSSSQKLAFFLKDMELPYLEGFESRLDSYYESRKNTKDTSHGKMFCFAPASCFCEIVEECIRELLDLSRTDLLSPIVTNSTTTVTTPVHNSHQQNAFPDQMPTTYQGTQIFGHLLDSRCEPQTRISYICGMEPGLHTTTTELPIPKMGSSCHLPPMLPPDCGLPPPGNSNPIGQTIQTPEPSNNHFPQQTWIPMIIPTSYCICHTRMWWHWSMPPWT